MKCITDPTKPKCQHCIICDVPCIFSPKKISSKRRLKSAKIAAILKIGDKGTEAKQEDLSINVNVNDLENMTPNFTTCAPSTLYIPESENSWSTQLQTNEIDDSPLEPCVSLPDQDTITNAALISLYSQYVLKNTPFIPISILSDTNINGLLSPLALSSIYLAVCLAVDVPLKSIKSARKSFFEKLESASLTTLDDLTVCTILLIPLRIHIPFEIIRLILSQFSPAYLELINRDVSSISPELKTGLIIVDSWFSWSYCVKPITDLDVNDSQVLKYLDSLGDVFAPFLFRGSILMYKTMFIFAKYLRTPVKLRPKPGEKEYRRWKYELLKLENATFITALSAPARYVICQEGKMADFGAVFLHILYNNITATQFCICLADPYFSKMLAITPISGCMHFLVGLMMSTFRYNYRMTKISKKWQILITSQVITSKLLWKLYESNEDFVKIQRALAFWEKYKNDFSTPFQGVISLNQGVEEKEESRSKTAVLKKKLVNASYPIPSTEFNNRKHRHSDSSGTRMFSQGSKAFTSYDSFNNSMVSNDDEICMPSNIEYSPFNFSPISGRSTPTVIDIDEVIDVTLPLSNAPLGFSLSKFKEDMPDSDVDIHIEKEQLNNIIVSKNELKWTNLASVENPEGALVFWMFRDVRFMTTELVYGDLKAEFEAQ